MILTRPSIRKFQLVLAIFLAFKSPGRADPSPQIGNLTVIVEGIEPNIGQIMVALHRSDRTFPSDWENADKLLKLSAGASPNQTITLEDIPKGIIALMVIQDLDMNNKMTKNFLGIPKEPFGTSNNPYFLGPPSFSKAKFDFKSGQQMVVKLVRI